MKVLLILNGEISAPILPLRSFDMVVATDGAINRLQRLDFDINLLHFIVGDLDSLSPENRERYRDKIMFTPDQNKTDFHKTLEVLLQKGAEEILVLGANGGELDHSLGNLTTAFHFRNQVKLIFQDPWATYFFAQKVERLEGVKGKLISLYPFPECSGLHSQGLQWELSGHHFTTVGQIGTRNRGRLDAVEISCEEGNYLLFVGH